MRKGQQKLIDRAISFGLQQEYIDRLRNYDETITLKTVETHLNFLIALNFQIEKGKEEYKQVENILDKGFSIAVLNQASYMISKNVKPTYITYTCNLKDIDKRQFFVNLLSSGYNLEDVRNITNFCFSELRKQIYTTINNTEIANWSSTIFEHAAKWGNPDISLLKNFAKQGYLYDIKTVKYALNKNILPEDLHNFIKPRTHYIDIFAVADAITPHLYQLPHTSTYLKNIDSKTLRKSLEPVFAIQKEDVILKQPYIERCLFSISDNAISFSFALTQSTKATYNNCEKNITFSKTGKPTAEDIFIVFFNNKNIYRKTKQDKIIPLTINNIPYYTKVYGYLFTDFFKAYCLDTGLGNITKDFISQSSTYILPPIPINECIDKKTPNDVCKQYYKNYKDINWNKLGLEKGYLLYKAKTVTDSKSHGILDNYFYNSDIIEQSLNKWNKYDFRKDPGRLICYIILTHKILREIIGENFDDNYIIDYIDICKKMSKKISLKYNSLKKVIDEHCYLVDQYELKEFPGGQLAKKNSKFNKLIKFMPSEYEWIKKKGRLIKEGKQQRNCVATYADSIHNDDCAIYSLIHNGKRYTIEITEYKGKYHLAQARGFANAPANEIIIENINQILEKANQ